MGYERAERQPRFAYERNPVSTEARRAYQRAWYHTHAEQERIRKEGYRQTCPDCGGTMGGGWGVKKNPKRCQSCDNKQREPAHGTDSRYSSVKWRCRCDLCRSAHAIAHRDWYRRAKSGAQAR